MVEIGHGPPKAILLNNIITKPRFENVQNILKTDRQTDPPTDRQSGG